jgi:hypothetical protein
VGKFWQDRRVETVLREEAGKLCRIDLDVDLVTADVDAGDESAQPGAARRSAGARSI